MIRSQTSAHPEVEQGVGSLAEAPGLRRLREIDGLVQSLVASWQSCGPVLERRRWHRVAFDGVLGVTALDEREATPNGPMQTVRGRDISLSGVAFTHAQPIPNRIVAVTFWDESGQAESIVTELNWCRFTRSGNYQSGGKFLRVIELPEASGDIRALRRA